MFEISIGSDEMGTVVIARSDYATGRVHLVEGAVAMLTGDFGNPISIAQLPLLRAALERAEAISAPVAAIEEAAFTARIQTDDVERDDYPQVADIVITAVGSDSTPVAAYNFGPLRGMIDFDDFLTPLGWRIVDDGRIDEENYLVVAVERIEPVGLELNAGTR